MRDSRPLASLALAIGYLLACLGGALAHGYLVTPASRNMVSLGRYQYASSAGNGLGPSPFRTLGNPGVCGDPFQAAAGQASTNFVGASPNIQATYIQGQTISITIDVNINHGGRFAFSVCSRNSNLDQTCFNQNPLQRCVVTTHGQLVCVMSLHGCQLSAVSIAQKSQTVSGVAASVHHGGLRFLACTRTPAAALLCGHDFPFSTCVDVASLLCSPGKQRRNIEHRRRRRSRLSDTINWHLQNWLDWARFCRADGNGLFWYLLTGSFNSQSSTNPQTISVSYKLPSGLSCPNGCMLQWTYKTYNSCVDACPSNVCGFYASRRNDITGQAGPLDYCAPVTSTVAEVFQNCADIRVRAHECIIARIVLVPYQALYWIWHASRSV